MSEITFNIKLINVQSLRKHYKDIGKDTYGPLRTTGHSCPTTLLSIFTYCTIIC